MAGLLGSSCPRGVPVRHHGEDDVEVTTMSEHATNGAGGEIGKARRRVEDNRLIRGAGRYPDDLAPRDALHAVFVRSPYPHARIATLDAEAAASAPGVAAV